MLWWFSRSFTWGLFLASGPTSSTTPRGSPSFSSQFWKSKGLWLYFCRKVLSLDSYWYLCFPRMLDLNPEKRPEPELLSLMITSPEKLPQIVSFWRRFCVNWIYIKCSPAGFWIQERGKEKDRAKRSKVSFWVGSDANLVQRRINCFFFVQ